MPSQPSGSAQPTNAGIVTDTVSGERHIPSSTRADGTTRKAIKIRPGYRPPEDVELYKNRTAEAYRDRGRRIGIPGAAAADDNSGGNDDGKAQASAAANKNAKRKEARKKAKAAANDDVGDVKVAAAPAETKEAGTEEVDPEVERQKKARNIKKKLKQAKDLKSKKEGGETLLPEQIAKVIKINELVRELAALGFDAEGEPKSKEDEEEVADDKKTGK